MNLSDVENGIDTWIASGIDERFAASQEAYRVEHDEYFQGLPTHSALPDRTNNGRSVGDRLERVPSDQPTPWTTFWAGAESEILLCCVTCDAVSTGRDRGYIITLSFTHDGASGHRQRQITGGDETVKVQYPDTLWQTIEPFAVP